MPDDVLPDFDKLAELDPGEYLIRKRDDGTITADCLGRHVILEPVNGGDRIFHRNAVTLIKGIGQRRTRWLVVEHGGTKVYFDDQTVIITAKDRYP
jgi:hypothetical protein